MLTRGVARGWADPELDPAQIDWTARLSRAAFPFQIQNGRPRNPFKTTSIRYGRNRLGRWGENLTGDALVTVMLSGRGTRLLLMERTDGRGWAAPGGFANLGESGTAAALRELGEEAGLTVPLRLCSPLPLRYSPDDRESDEAWIVTAPVHVNLGTRAALPAITPGSDARRGGWIAADTYKDLVRTLGQEYGGRVFTPHVAMLGEFLQTLNHGGPELGPLLSAHVGAPDPHVLAAVPAMFTPRDWHDRDDLLGSVLRALEAAARGTRSTRRPGNAAAAALACERTLTGPLSPAAQSAHDRISSMQDHTAEEPPAGPGSPPPGSEAEALADELPRTMARLARLADPAGPHRTPEAASQARDRGARLLLESLPQNPLFNVPGWHLWQEHIPHVLTLARAVTPDNDTLDTAGVLLAASGFLQATGQPEQAVATAGRSADAYRRLLGPDAVETLSARSFLASAHRAAGDLAAAAPLHQQNLADCERALGEDHPETLVARANLAYLYALQDQPARALELHEQNLADCERVHGPDHPHTINARANLASSHRALGHHGRALELSRQSLADYARVFGADHSETITARSNLACAYQLAGDLGQAVALHLQVLALRERLYGPDHDHTLMARQLLAAAEQQAAAREPTGSQDAREFAE